MKVEFDVDGKLTLISQTHLEAFALAQWDKIATRKKGEAIKIKTEEVFDMKKIYAILDDAGKNAKEYLEWRKSNNKLIPGIDVEREPLAVDMSHIVASK